MQSTTACRSKNRGTRRRPGLCPPPGLTWSGRAQSRAASGNARRLPSLTAGAAAASDAPAEGHWTCLLGRESRLCGRLRSVLSGSRHAAHRPLARVFLPSGTQREGPSRRPEKNFPSFCQKRDTLGPKAGKQQRPIFFRGQGAAAKHKRFTCSLPPQTAYLQGKQTEPCGCSTPTAAALRCCAGYAFSRRAGGCQ